MIYRHLDYHCHADHIFPSPMASLSDVASIQSERAAMNQTNVISTGLSQFKSARISSWDQGKKKTYIAQADSE